MYSTEVRAHFFFINFLFKKKKKHAFYVQAHRSPGRRGKSLQIRKKRKTTMNLFFFFFFFLFVNLPRRMKNQGMLNDQTHLKQVHCSHLFVLKSLVQSHTVTID